MPQNAPTLIRTYTFGAKAYAIGTVRRRRRSPSNMAETKKIPQSLQHWIKNAGNRVHQIRRQNGLEKLHAQVMQKIFQFTVDFRQREQCHNRILDGTQFATCQRSLHRREVEGPPGTVSQNLRGTLRTSKSLSGIAIIMQTNIWEGNKINQKNNLRIIVWILTFLANCFFWAGAWQLDLIAYPLVWEKDWIYLLPFNIGISAQIGYCLMFTWMIVSTWVLTGLIIVLMEKRCLKG